MVNCNIEIGDKVYIGGVNKIGEIKRIMFSSTEYIKSYIADVEITSILHSISLDNIYKVDDLDTYQYDGLFDGDAPPLEYYFNKYNVVGEPVMVYDQLGLNYLYYKTREDNVKSLKLTSLN